MDHNIDKLELNFQFFCPDTGPARLGESPAWDSLNNQLWWVDIDGAQLLCLDIESGKTHVWETPEVPGFVVVTCSGQPAIGMETGIYLCDFPNFNFTRIVEYNVSGHRFNDATVDSAGRLWVSTMSLTAEQGGAGLHRVTDDLGLECIQDGLTIPNGMVVDTGRDLLYFSDSFKNTQSIWTVPTAQASKKPERQLFTTTHALAGRPDGAALDTQGNYWIAGVDGAELYVFNLQGQLRMTVRVPFEAPTKVGFWGADGRKLAITSKGTDKKGGCLAIADLPSELAPGIVQADWIVPTLMEGAV